MSTPSDERDRYLSTYDWSGIRIAWEVRHAFNPSHATVLDVGAGWGKYRDLLPEYAMDAVEVWAPNVEAENLRRRYRHVFEQDVCTLAFDEGLWWDAIILGDVFEHLTVDQATEVLPRLVDACDELYVAVPFHYAQGEVGGNPYEVHHQDDLDEEMMSWRYRHWLRPLYTDSDKAIYVSTREDT